MCCAYAPITNSKQKKTNASLATFHDGRRGTYEPLYAKLEGKKKQKLTALETSYATLCGKLNGMKKCAVVRRKKKKLQSYAKRMFVRLSKEFNRSENG